jgi:hypothetical protein
MIQREYEEQYKGLFFHKQTFDQIPAAHRALSGESMSSLAFDATSKLIIISCLEFTATCNGVCEKESKESAGK